MNPSGRIAAAVTRLCIEQHEELDGLSRDISRELPDLSENQIAMLTLWASLRGALISSGIHPDILDAFAIGQDRAMGVTR